jgi:hypothetical protein
MSTDGENEPPAVVVIETAPKLIGEEVALGVNACG